MKIMFYLGVNIGNYIIDATDTSGVTINMNGNDKSKLKYSDIELNILIQMIIMYIQMNHLMKQLFYQIQIIC